MWSSHTKLGSLWCQRWVHNRIVNKRNIENSAQRVGVASICHQSNDSHISRYNENWETFYRHHRHSDCALGNYQSKTMHLHLLLSGKLLPTISIHNALVYSLTSMLQHTDTQNSMPSIAPASFSGICSYISTNTQQQKQQQLQSSIGTLN